MATDREGSWAGFRATPYALDREKVQNLPFRRVCEGGQEAEESPITLFAAFLEATNEPITSEFIFFNMHVEEEEVTVCHDTHEQAFVGSRFNCQLLEALIKLRMKGVENPFDTAWCWFGSDYCVDDPLEADDFFLVHNKQIVLERWTLTRRPFHDERDGFDPTVFVVADQGADGWGHDAAQHGAVVRYWYRKFYQDTMPGQLMVLRDDRPELYYFPEGAQLRRLAGVSDAAEDEQHTKELDRLQRVAEAALRELSVLRVRLDGIVRALWVLGILIVILTLLRR